jgi:hypothetical protein
MDGNFSLAKEKISMKTRTYVAQLKMENQV